jgi:hypothetical protein
MERGAPHEAQADDCDVASTHQISFPKGASTFRRMVPTKTCARRPTLLRSVQGRTMSSIQRTNALLTLRRSTLIVCVGCPFSRTQDRQSPETIRRLRPSPAALDICHHGGQKVQIRPREVETGHTPIGALPSRPETVRRVVELGLRGKAK